MSDELDEVEKIAHYDQLLLEVKGLVTGEEDLIANLANITAAIHYRMDFWWTGFYFAKGKELVLGPFQGPVACTRIAYDKGVCGKSWASKETLVVPDVHLFPGHIACSAASNSEIVLPIFDKNNEVAMVLDIDSEHFNTFNETDQLYLEKICRIISDLL
tara:strand:+ start:453669 stop:454145 length:477 start_codon:yes stop_codon:yes gene_type:complete